MMSDGDSYALGPPLSSSLVPAHTGEYGAEICLILGVSSQTIPTISHPLLGRCFLKPILDLCLSKRRTEILGK